MKIRKQIQRRRNRRKMRNKVESIRRDFEIIRNPEINTQQRQLLLNEYLLNNKIGRLYYNFLIIV